MKMISRYVLGWPSILLLLMLAMRLEALPAQTPALPHSPTAYGSGMEAINKRRWDDAVRAFDKAIESHASNADAALYWKAYSLNKLGQPPSVAATCDQLRVQYVTSSWNRDCADLILQLKQMPPGTDSLPTSHAPGAPEGAPIDYRVLQANALLNTAPEKAIPLLQSMLTNDEPHGIRAAALFVLVQSKAPTAQRFVQTLVLTPKDTNLQLDAIQALGIFHPSGSSDLLMTAYRKDGDSRVKRAVISALFIASDSSALVNLARAEKDKTLKGDIVSQLAIIHDKTAVDYLQEVIK